MCNASVTVTEPFRILRMIFLRTTPVAKVAHVQMLLDLASRMRKITGLSAECILDIILQSVDARKRACATLLGHVDEHGCAPATACLWPEPCRTCKATDPCRQAKAQ
jgi:hypothetical protein